MARKDAEENREALLDAARVLLSQDATASMESIATAAGLSRRTAYGHFATRDALLEALAERGTARVVAAVEAVDHPDAAVRLALIAAAVWDDLASIRAVTVMTLTSSRVAVVDRGLAPLRARLVATIRDGAATGSLRGDMPADRVARLVEDAVIATFPLTLRERLDADEGRLLVVRVALGAAGLGWREQATLLDAHPEIASPRPRTDPLWPPTGAITAVPAPGPRSTDAAGGSR